MTTGPVHPIPVFAKILFFHKATLASSSSRISIPPIVAVACSSAGHLTSSSGSAFLAPAEVIFSKIALRPALFAFSNSF